MSTFFNPTPTNFYEDYICHHGIKGQKWGVRNGPPYPLDSSDKKKSVSDSGSIKKKTNKTNKTKVTSETKKYEWGQLEHHKINSGGQSTKSVDETLDKNLKSMEEEFPNYDWSKANIYDYADFNDFDKYDSIGCNALSKFYDTKNLDDAISYLDKKFGDQKYDFNITIESDDEFEYPMFELTVYGKDYAYRTYGETDYTDEQQFIKVKK